MISPPPLQYLTGRDVQFVQRCFLMSSVWYEGLHWPVMSRAGLDQILYKMFPRHSLPPVRLDHLH